MTSKETKRLRSYCISASVFGFIDIFMLTAISMMGTSDDTAFLVASVISGLVASAMTGIYISLIIEVVLVRLDRMEK